MGDGMGDIMDGMDMGDIMGFMGEGKDKDKDKGSFMVIMVGDGETAVMGIIGNSSAIPVIISSSSGGVTTKNLNNLNNTPI
jgi:hypothetical protein